MTLRAQPEGGVERSELNLSKGWTQGIALAMVLGSFVMGRLGFLLVSMIGIDEGDDLDASYLYLFAGIVIGGIGVGLALLGTRRVLRDRRAA
ncbi:MULTISPECIES: hypothetical protein [unclassified Nocardioides]|uniref:hypothetical protein n=1 Tax=unclassified Nocardioides TaxID=2615069 RepID=UPI0000570C2E|nr:MULTISPECIES: hypothetical protein [unclassified Nocardioides]ABL83798.1 hypothetical protein Noca_4301 [Nocardioides sp. JS614]